MDRGHLGRTGHIAAAIAALLLSCPLAVEAKPIGTYAVIVQGPGDQTDPSIDAQFIVFSSDAGGDWDVLLYEIGAVPDGNVRVVAGGAGDQDQPSIHRTTLAYRTQAGVVVANWELGVPLRTPDPSAPPDPSRRCRPLDPVRSPVVSDALAAWECGDAGARTIVVARYRGQLEEYEVASSGDRFGPSASGALVAFVDASDGSVWLHDSTPTSRQTTRVCDGRATGVSIGGVGPPVLAVARAGAKPDADIEIWDPTGGLGTAGLVAALVVPGEQRNPHLSGEWVAFEDLSTGVSQVVLWQWTTGLVFVPHPSTSNQTLNDLGVVSATEVRAVYADDLDGTGGPRDIALYRLAYVNGTIPDDGTGNPSPWAPPPPPPPVRPPPVSCDDDAVEVLGTLVLGRGTGAPNAGKVTFTAVPFGHDRFLPVLVCVDVQHVTSGWLTLDDEAIATPCDFKESLQHLERRGELEPGPGRLAGTIAGKPGATLVARVLADPGRYRQGDSDDGGHGGDGDVVTSTTTSSPDSGPTRSSTSAGAAAGGPGKAGCGTAGAAGPLGAVAWLLALRLRRRRARGG